MDEQVKCRKCCGHTAASRRPKKSDHRKHHHAIVSRPIAPSVPAPQLPRNFNWCGRYRVPDLKIDVSLRWFGRDGDVQMIAGDDNSLIHFTNIIYQGNFYTYTFRWPGLQPPFLPPLEPCQPVPFSRDTLNAFLAAHAQFVGPETIGCPAKRVHHFRVSVVLPPCPSGAFFRVPIALADIYVDRDDPSIWWQLLQFGLQNIYDPALDEWAIIQHVSSRPPPEVILPPACQTPNRSMTTVTETPTQPEVGSPASLPCIPLPAPRGFGGLSVRSILEQFKDVAKSN
jgi:hypothetical protein